MNFCIYIISHLRADNVKKMQNLIGDACEVCWVVGDGERADYEEAGARNVIEGGGLCESRNAAIRDAEKNGFYCLQLSDDLSKVLRAVSKKQTLEITVYEAASEMVEHLKNSPFALAGVAPTANPFYFNPEKPIKIKNFIVGDMIAIKPHSGLFFDEGLRLKEDYDYTLQHIEKFGGVVRADYLMPMFAHRSNPGGAVAYRNHEREQEAISYLKRKWPGNIVDNPRRKDEILLRI